MEIKLPPTVPPTEFSDRFAQGMADRMAVSYCKYGAVADAYPARVDAIASLKKVIILFTNPREQEPLGLEGRRLV